MPPSPSPLHFDRRLHGPEERGDPVPAMAAERDRRLGRSGAPNYRFPAAGQAETKKKRGAIPVPRRLLTVLRFARQRTRQFVFESRGELVKDVKKSLATAWKNAGLEHVHAHLLKHTAVTWLARRGVPMEDVSLYTDTAVDTLHGVYRQHSPDMRSAVLKAFK